MFGVLHPPHQRFGVLFAFGVHFFKAVKVDPAEVSKYAQVAQDILKGIGGKDNVVSASYCTTRLRFVVKNYNQVNEQAVKAAGASGIIRPGKNACQVIVGTKVKSIYDELDKLLK